MASNSRDDVKPGPNDFPKIKRGESFDVAMNPPNNPKKDKAPALYGDDENYHYSVSCNYPPYADGNDD